MSKLIVYFGDNPECIEGFSKSCSRSVDGALHLKPRKPMTVTDDEYKHITESRADLKGKIRVVADKPDQSEKGKPAEAAKAVEASDPVEKPAVSSDQPEVKEPKAEDASSSFKSGKKKF